MRTLLEDLRFGWRLLWRSPGFTLAVVTVLALGIGANSATFSLVHAVLLKPLPYHEPERLFQIQEVNPKGDPAGVAPMDMAAFSRHDRVFESLALSTWDNGTLTGAEGADNVFGAKTTSEFFPTMGVAPRLGRGFRADEFKAGAAGVVLLSDRLWRRRYHADPGVVGRSMMINGSSYSIIGVLGPEFFYGQRFEYWIPWQLTADAFSSRDFSHVPCLARLKPGVDPRTAQAELAAEFGHVAAEDVRKGWTIRITSLNDVFLSRSRTSLLVLLGAVGFVLLIACTNVANLLLVRGVDRVREMSIRAALGASRMRTFRQVLTESLLLAGLSGLGGLGIGWLGQKALVAWIPRHMGIPRIEQTSLDGQVLAFTGLLVVLTGILFGLVPAWQASRSEIGEALKSGMRGSSAGSSRWTRYALIVVETALSVVLLAGAGLMLRSFVGLLSIDPGFRAERVYTLRVPPPVGLNDKAQQKLYYHRLLDEVQRVPGVSSAGLVNPLPLGGVENRGTFGIEGKPFAPGERPLVRLRVASPGFFSAMGLKLITGRWFRDTDTADAPGVALINQTFAKRHFPGESPVGKRVSMGDKIWLEVVGVVADVTGVDLSETAEPDLYRPARQYLLAPFATSIALRSSELDPAAVASAVERQIRSAFPDQPVLDVLPMKEVVSSAVAQPRLYTGLLTGFAAVALALAAAGLYGVLAFLVSRRSREIGIRIAMGASRSAILKLVMAPVLGLVGTGLAAGLVAAVALTRFLSSQLYGVQPGDPATYAAVCLVLLAVAGMAAWLPARRATRIDPAEALRVE